MEHVVDYKYIVVTTSKVTGKTEFHGFRSLADAVSSHKSGSLFIRKGIMELVEQQALRLEMEIASINEKIRNIKKELEETVI